MRWCASSSLATRRSSSDGGSQCGCSRGYIARSSKMDFDVFWGSLALVAAIVGLEVWLQEAAWLQRDCERPRGFPEGPCRQVSLRPGRDVQCPRLRLPLVNTTLSHHTSHVASEWLTDTNQHLNRLALRTRSRRAQRAPRGHGRKETSRGYERPARRR